MGEFSIGPARGHFVLAVGLILIDTIITGVRYSSVQPAVKVTVSHYDTN